MPEDVTDAFCADPEGFMRRNVVMQTIPSDTPAGVIGIRMFAGAAKVEGDGDAKVCFTRLASKGQVPSLPAYWCPYEQDKMKSVMLGDDALFAFTPTMDGCSVGLGSATSTGAQMMSHVNAARIGREWESEGIATARARQASSQNAQLRYKLGNDANILSPEDYRPKGKMSSTTFAVHPLGKPWTLYTLTYRKNVQGNYVHGGVKAR